MKKIIVGFLMSYDYEKLKLSIPPVYKYSDKIYIALDYKLRTWNGGSFDVDPKFYDWVSSFDKDDKIIFYKDNFYVPNLSPIQNDTRERHMLSLKMGIGNWLIQVDADEIFLDFKKFVSTLNKYNNYLNNPKKTPIQVAGFLINIYKYLDDGLLYVNTPTKVMLATNYPNYKRARNNKERVIYTNNVLLHECLSRDEETLRFKLENWGHSDDINDQFFSKWKKATKHNYKELKDVFYLNPKIWKSLGYLALVNINDVKQFAKENNKLSPSGFFLFKKNFGQWFKFLKPFNRSKKEFEPYFDKLES